MNKLEYKFSNICQLLGFNRIGPDVLFNTHQICTDTRQIKKNNVFLALKGPSFDGSKFYKQAVQKGASGLILSKKIESEIGVKEISGKTGVIFVEDTLVTLNQIANLVRKDSGLKVCAVTGSIGKTTTKEILAELLIGLTGGKKKVLKTEGNFNNLIGLPLTILKYSKSNEIAVLEMGMNMKGEIEKLTQTALPDAGVITNVYPVHLEGLGSLQGILEAKMELFKTMSSNSNTVINMDDLMISSACEGLSNPKVTFGTKFDCDVRVINANSSVEMGVQATFLFDRKHEVKTIIPLIGSHNALNAASALGLVKSLGFDPVYACKFLKNVKSIKGRMIVKKAGGLTILDDSYNASPVSVEKAIDILIKNAGGNNKAVALGDMLELGESAENSHYKLGKTAALKGVNFIGAFGSLSEKIVQGAVENGMPFKNIKHFDNHETLGEWIISKTGKNGWVLCKGSMTMKMGKVADYIVNSINH